ncbi:MAG: SAVED domain-containing protein [bacterium]
MVKEVTRYIKRGVERELWARAGGRCQFQGCNELAYKSSVTHERVNAAEMAHIYSFSKDGPRGWRGFLADKRALNNVSNLLLVCRKCHKTIDQDETGAKYSAELLQTWKRQHEDRVRVVTGISPTKNSHVILYGGKIGEEDSPLQPDLAIEAMFSDWYPADDRVIDLGLKYEHEDKSADFWRTEAAHLRAGFERHIRGRIEEAQPNHFSIFARADMPLLILLGSLLTDKVPSEVYQLHREPHTWKWQDHPDGFAYEINVPPETKAPPVLVVSLSARIHPDRISAVVPSPVSVWEITVDECHNDFLKSKVQLSMFRTAMRKLLADIGHAHPTASDLKIFPAMPVACAVELGRVRMPKADGKWSIYDQNHKLNKFIPALEIGGTP